MADRPSINRSIPRTQSDTYQANAWNAQDANEDAALIISHATDIEAVEGRVTDLESNPSGGTAATTTYDSSAETSGNLVADKTDLQEAVKEVRDFINQPSKAKGTFTGELVEISDSGVYTDKTLSSNTQITFAESAHVEGNNHFVLITTSGAYTLQFVKPTAYNLYLPSDFTNGGTLAAGSYLFGFAFIGGSIKVNYIEVVGIGVIPVLTAPTIGTATADSNTQITLTWTDTNTSPNEEGFEIEYDTVNTFATAQSTTASADATSKAITGLTEDTLYYFRVRSTGDGVDTLTSGWSGTASEATNAADVTAPTLSIFFIEDSNTSRVYFSSSEVITGTTYSGFTISGKTITGLTINSGQTTGHYFTVSVAFVFGDTATIAYTGTGSNIQDGSANALAAFTAVSITNNISENSLARQTGNGTNYFIAPNTSLGNIAGDWTLSFWVYPYEIDAAKILICKRRNTPSVVQEWEIDFGGTGSKLRFYAQQESGGTVTLVETTATMTIGNWYHVVAAYSSSTKKVSLIVNNGTASVAATALTISPKTSLVEMAIARIVAFSTLYAGYDDIAMWNRLLTANEITWLYAKNKYIDVGTGDGSALATNLVAWWDCNEASGNLIDVHSTNDLTQEGTCPSITGI